MRYTKEQLENALKACIDLLKDLQEEGNDWLESEFDNLTAYHPLITKVGGFYHQWNKQDECWERTE